MIRCGNRAADGSLTRLVVLVASVLLAGSVTLIYPTTAIANGNKCGNNYGGHYAGQATALDSSYTQCGPLHEYGGWNGVDGSLNVPSTLASLGNYQTDHTIGLFSAQLNSDRYWVQPGWYTGCIANLANCAGTCQPPICTWRGVSYGWYIENLSPAGYQLHDFNQAPLGSARTVYTIYNSSDGCWEVQLSYGGPINWSDCNEYPSYISGAMFAEAEMFDKSGVAPGLPATYFGYSNPNTNEALRLHGGNGWVPWQAPLSSYYTETWDERSYTPKYTNLTLDNYWYFEAYSG